MQSSTDISSQENQYLSETITFLEERLDQEHTDIDKQKEELITLHRDMYANQPASGDDTSRIAEQAQMMSPLMIQTTNYHASEQRIRLFKRMLTAPYFARIDFDTPNWDSEIVYIGLGNLENEDTFDVYVYDWRAPIASVFYRYELGKASYKAPAGTIEGEVTLKRQYEIRNGKLYYFFDSGVNILDEILKQTLSQNSSPQMRTIVETIQREQDIIIRDIENDLVIVQGVAGSGKTSIALHRAAYLMYDGLSAKTSAKSMILISPNRLFEQYISQVLPELGEENIRSLTFEDIFQDLLSQEDIHWELESRNTMLERIFTQTDQIMHDFLHYTYVYKTTEEYLAILNWYIPYYIEELVIFPDFTFGEQVVAQGSMLRERMITAYHGGTTAQASMRQVEIYLTSVVEEMQKERLKELEKQLSNHEDHVFDYKQRAREILYAENQTFRENVAHYVEIDYLALYREMVGNPAVIKTISEKYYDFEACARQTLLDLKQEHLPYVDAMAILYLKVKMDTIKPYQKIRQVVVDEAQDYSPIHFEILHSLFPTAKYTILADVNQTLLDTETDSLYNNIRSVLNKKKCTQVSLNKSFRCSYEIASFSRYFADADAIIDVDILKRHEKPPFIIGAEPAELDHAIVTAITGWQKDGYGTIALICKSMKESRQLYDRLKDKLPLDLLEEQGSVNLSNPVILPVYLAKGLEFDAVAVCGVNAENYYSEDHRRLLYISCTRPLHRLGVFYSGKPSPFLPKDFAKGK